MEYDDNEVLILTDEPVNIRDSWDVLETPRTSESETDVVIETQPLSYSDRSDSLYERSYTRSRPHKPKKEIYEYVSPQRYQTRNKPRKQDSVHNEYNQQPQRRRTQRPLSASNGILKNDTNVSRVVTSRLKRPENVKFIGNEQETPKIIPRRYRKLGLRSHDDMLQEQFNKLRILLNDSANMSRDELSRQHVEQTRNMIADYKIMNGGARTRGIIVSRSLPESLRPKSPRSTSSSSMRSSREESYRSYSSSRSPSPPSRRSKKVSFQTSRKKSDQRKKRSISTSSTSRERSASPQHTTKHNNSSESETHRDSSNERREKSDERRSSRSGESDHSDNEYNDKSDHEEKRSVESDQEPSPRTGSLEEELFKRRRSRKTKVHHYISNGKSVSKNEHRKASANKYTEGYSREDKKNIRAVEDRDELQYNSDDSVKCKSVPDFKHWLREKEKAIKDMKKKQKKKEEKQKAAEERELQKKVERKAESERKLKEWQATKRKEARLLRRQNIAKRKLERQHVSGSETELPQHIRYDVSKPTSQTSPIKLRPPTKPRPMSAPASRRRAVRPQQVPLAQVLQQSPDLQEKLKQLEKQRRLKHRQSYDEWVKSKEKEKRDTLKKIRERRLEMEKEISEETAKVISEAAKRRMDNIRYKGSTETQEKKEPSKDETPTESEPPKPSPYSWKTGSPGEGGNCTNGRHSKDATPRTAPVSPQRRAQSASKRAAKKPVEEKILPESASNPFSDPFKPPKLRRPKSKLEQSGVNGPEFSRFIWELVNEQENGGNRPEPQGADSPNKSAESPTPNGEAEAKNLKPHPPPQQSKSPTPPATSTTQTDEVKPQTDHIGEPVIESGRTIFAMTSIE